MILNDKMTQPERVAFHLDLLEKEKIDFGDKDTLYTLLPHYVIKVANNKILFFNKYGDVIIDFLHDYFYTENFNTVEDKNFYKKASNFDCIFIEYKMNENIVYFFNEKLTKKGIPKYLQKVKNFLSLLPN